MSNRSRPQARPSPTGAARIAFSYLAVVLGLIIMGILLAIWSIPTDAICTDDSDVLCGLSWLWLGALLGLVAGTGVTARVFRLGWEWWVAVVVGVLAVPAVSALPGPVLWLFVALWPAAAGALTWSGSQARPRWRPWLIVGLAVLAGGVSLASLFL